MGTIIGKNKPPKLKKILVIPSDRTGVSFFRSTKPHIILEKEFPEFKVDIIYTKDINFKDVKFFKNYSLIHFHRTILDYDEMPGFFKKMKTLNIPTVMDLDDYWLTGKHHPSHIIFEKHNISEKIRTNLKYSDYVTTTTSLLANEISKINNNVEIIPNGIDINDKQFKPTHEQSERVRIGWLGGSSHLHDLELLHGLVNKLKGDNLLDKIQFVLCGFDIRGTKTSYKPDGTSEVTKIKPEETVWFKYETIFTDNYTIVSEKYKDHLLSFSKKDYSNVENEPYRRVWTKPVTSYAKNYNLIDISLAPLVDNKFNAMKSQLKIIEAGFHNKVIVASDIGPYKLDCDNSYNGNGQYNTDKNLILVKNQKDWYTHIKKLILDKNLRDNLSNNLNEYVTKKYSLQELAKIRAKFYNKIINK